MTVEVETLESALSKQLWKILRIWLSRGEIVLLLTWGCAPNAMFSTSRSWPRGLANLGELLGHRRCHCCQRYQWAIHNAQHEIHQSRCKGRTTATSNSSFAYWLCFQVHSTSIQSDFHSEGCRCRLPVLHLGGLSLFGTDEPWAWVGWRFGFKCNVNWVECKFGLGWM